jgi:molybdopterin converting factor small subunit
MKVELKLFATLADYLPADARSTNSVQLELAQGITVDEVIGRFKLPLKLVHLVLVNGAYVPPAARAARLLAENDTLAIWPPIAGG